MQLDKTENNGALRSWILTKIFKKKSLPFLVWDPVAQEVGK